MSATNDHDDDRDAWASKRYIYQHCDEAQALLFQHLLTLVKQAYKAKYGHYLNPRASSASLVESQARGAVIKILLDNEFHLTLSPVRFTNHQHDISLELTITRVFVLDLLGRGEVPPIDDPDDNRRPLYPCSVRGCPKRLAEDNPGVLAMSSITGSFATPKRGSSEECLVCRRSIKDGVSRDYDEVDAAGHRNEIARGPELTQFFQPMLDTILRDQESYLPVDPIFDYPDKYLSSHSQETVDRTDI